MKQEHRQTYLYLMVTFILWGSLYVVSQYVLGEIPTFLTALLRYLFSFLALSAVSCGKPREVVERKDYKYFFVVGFIGYFVAIDCQLLGTKLAGSSMASLINSLNPVFITVMAALILKEKLTKSKLVGLALSIAGVYLIIGRGSSASAAGIACSILAVTGWAFMSVITRKISKKYSALTITKYAMLIAVVCNVPTEYWR